MRVSVIVATYNQPALLEKTLWGYARQKGQQFELIVADDGSGPATREVVDRVSRDGNLHLVHVWHEDRGFRKTEILNRAILISHGDYLIFSDGDCIPREDFVSAHARLAAQGCFLSGGYLKLSSETSDQITVDDIRSGDALNERWLRDHGWRAGKKAFRLTRSSIVASMLDRFTPTHRTWNGHNSSTWRDLLLKVNGFDIDMEYGGLDRALGERMMNAGVRGIQVRYRIPCLHLFHERPYDNPERWKRNYEIRDRIRRNREIRAQRGIAELPPDDGFVVRRPNAAPDRSDVKAGSAG